MDLGFNRLLFYLCLFWLGMAQIADAVTLTVIPSSDVVVNQSVTLQCDLDPNPTPPIIVLFIVQTPPSTLCILEPNNGVCRDTNPCHTLYNASCPSNTRYSIQVTVPGDWNNVSVVCQTIYASSNSVAFSVSVPVISAILIPSLITVVSGQQMNLTCITSQSNPAARVTWYKSLVDITSQSTSTTEMSEGLVRTVSSLLSTVVKYDNGKRVYCTASNIPGKSVTSSVETINVLYKPEVVSGQSKPYRVREGEIATRTCTIIDANPNTGITWRWIKRDSPNTVLHNGPNYTMPAITRERSGSYNCTASNSVGTSEAATVEVDVQYKPEVKLGLLSPYTVREGQTATLTCTVIAANPNTGITWRWIKTDNPNTVLYRGPTYIIPNITREKSGSYNCTASNSVGTSEAATVEVDVQCMPISDVGNITISVTNCTELAFSTTVIAYPRPCYVLLFENGSKNTGILDSMTVNAVHNFTIHFSKRTVELSDYGTYHLYINNTFGETIVFVFVIPQRKPDSPRMVAVTCDVRSAKLRWISSFNGGISQTFIALASIGQQEYSRFEAIHDRGENIIHETQLLNLQPSTKYMFYVVAQNKHGNSLSRKISCNTLEETHDQTPVIAGGIGGTLALVTLIFAVVLLVHRRYTCSLRFEKRKISKVSKDNDETTHYTTMTEQEKTERNLYEELTQNESQYEAVSRDSEGADTQMYEKLPNNESIEKQIPYDDRITVSRKYDSSKQTHETSMTKTENVHMNTSLME